MITEDDLTSIWQAIERIDNRFVELLCELNEIAQDGLRNKYDINILQTEVNSLKNDVRYLK